MDRNNNGKNCRTIEKRKGENNMNIKKVAVGMISSAMVLTMGIGSYATSEVEENKVLTAAIEIVSDSLEDENLKSEMKVIPLTEAQLAQKQAQIDEQMEKWTALSEAEKDQVYEISAKSREVLKDMVQKYLSLDLIDQDEADKILEQIEQQAEMEENGDMPPLGGGFGKGMNMIKRINIDTEPIPATETTSAIEIGLSIDENIETA